MTAGLVDPYIVVLGLVGALMLGVAALPLLVHELPLSVPVILLLLGGAIGATGAGDTIPGLQKAPEATERITELLVLISLMGAGLKLDTPIGWRRWAPTWRLLGITMPLSIAGIALLGWWILDLGPAAALLLGAILAPTDPVLAADVQVGRPGEGDKGRVRFALTAEAGLNDGLAFPFVNLALAVAAHGAEPGVWALEWLARDVVWKLSAGIAVGWAAGRLAGRLLFRLPKGTGLAESRDGFVALGLTALAYSLTELVHGYGFLGVFVAALTLRAVERDHVYHRQLHDFAVEMERLTLAVLLIVLGASFTSQFLHLVTGPVLALSLLVLLVVRPLAGLVGFVGSREPLPERLAVSFFGIRGMGSFYYLAHAVTSGGWREDSGVLWATVTVVVVLSILIHGISATPVMRRVERRA
ncbi:cation:proton antiporter [Benzoatithermus flavus]|uniref:Cation:proton antiporter n=1 Tax=Benzoatithermus flavus TaxID=3108223 RepID=A0ABU8XX34_9PROT